MAHLATTELQKQIAATMGRGLGQSGGDRQVQLCATGAGLDEQVAARGQAQA